MAHSAVVRTLVRSTWICVLVFGIYLFHPCPATGVNSEPRVLLFGRGVVCSYLLGERRLAKTSEGGVNCRIVRIAQIARIIANLNQANNGIAAG